MFEQLIQYQNYGFLILRLAIAVIFIYHAIPKLKNPQGMAGAIGWRPWKVKLLGLVEFFPALALILGIYIQFAALLLAVVMIGALYFKISKWQVPFSAQDKMGWEFDLILLAANIMIILSGAGAFKLW